MADIGSLRAALELESAAFIRDFKKAQQETARNTTAMRRSMDAMDRGFTTAANNIKAAVAAYAGIEGIRALGRLAKASIDAADEIATAATRMGVNAEALQRFRFAAEQADVDVAQLDAGFRLFTQNLANGKLAKELGEISPALLDQVKAAGDITGAFQTYIGAIADAPTQLEKARLAQAAFGKQWQSALLLAAQGSEEFKRQAASAFVISDDALKVAGELDNQFRAMRNAVSTGFATGFIESFDGALADTEGSLADLNRSVQEFGRVTGEVFKLATASVTTLGKEMAVNAEQTAAYVELFDQFKSGAIGAGEFLSGILDPRKTINSLKGIQQATDFWRGALGGGAGAGATGLGDTGGGLGGIGNPDAIKAAREEWNAYVDTLKEGQTVWEGTRTVAEQYELQLIKLNMLYDQGAISADTYMRAQKAAAEQVGADWATATGSIAGSFAQIGETFGKEGSAMAQAAQVLGAIQATISAYTGAAKALELPFPANLAAMAAVLAQGLSFAAQIRSQSIPAFAQGGEFRVGGVGGIDSQLVMFRASPDETVTVTPPGKGGGLGGGGDLHLTIEGETFGREQVIKMAKAFLRYQGDGGKLFLKRS